MKSKYRNADERLFILTRLRDGYRSGRCKVQKMVYYRVGYWYHMDTGKMCGHGMNDDVS